MFERFDLNLDAKVGRDEMIKEVADSFVPQCIDSLDDKLDRYWSLTRNNFDGELSFENLYNSEIVPVEY